MTIPEGAIATRNARNAIDLVRGRFELTHSVGDSSDMADPKVAQIRNLLLDMSHDLGMVAPGTDYEAVNDTMSPIGRHISFVQTINGIAVFGSHIRFQIDGNKIVQMRIGRYLDRTAQQVHTPTDADDELTSGEIRSIVRKNIEDDTAKEDTSPPRKVYFPYDEDELRLAYCIESVGFEADLRLIIDAYSGEIYSKDNTRVGVDGKGKVYDPNPVVVANDNSLEEGVTPETVLNSLMTTRTLRDISQQDGEFFLEGPYCKIINKRSPNINPPKEKGRTFNYVRTDDNFEAANIYYHIDSLQRYIQQTLGIKNVMHWSIPADHHTTGGAFYSASGKYLGFGDSGPTRPDRGEDGDVVAHEYGHAIQHDMVPNWGQPSQKTKRNEARAMGEGFGDILACVYFYEAGGIFQPQVFEDWIFGANPPPGASHAGPGLRRVDGGKTYPGESTSGADGDWEAGGSHANGEIWSATLWDAFVASRGESSIAEVRTAVRKDFLRTVILHHFKLIGSETMPEAAEAMLETNAEDPDIRGRQLRELVNAFQDRNILFSEVGVDLWLKDSPSHSGRELVEEKFWDSPDVWVRNREDDVYGHQPPKAGRDNWFYARVRNRGTSPARAFVVTFEAKLWLGTEFTYKNDFVPYISAAVGFNLAPGASTIVKARWPKEEVPAADSHGCLLVSAYCPTDEAIASKHVWEDNNLAQKNLTIINLSPRQSSDITFRVGSIYNNSRTLSRIEISRPIGREDLPIAIYHPDKKFTSRLFRSTDDGCITASSPRLRSFQDMKVNSHTDHFMASSSNDLKLTLLDSTRVVISSMAGVREHGHSGMEIHLERGSEIISRNLPHSEDRIGNRNLHSGTFLDKEANLLEAGDDVSPTFIALRPGRLVGFPVSLGPRVSPQLKLRVTAPSDAAAGDEFEINVMERDQGGKLIGGIAILVRIR